VRYQVEAAPGEDALSHFETLRRLGAPDVRSVRVEEE
jgi:hypothetical protein